jgi:uncharacterized repeat protein (TIGR03803 family)
LSLEPLEERQTPSFTTLTSLYDAVQGASPYGTPLRDPLGNFFGTTRQGGPSGDGTIFEIKAGSTAITTLAAFNGANGANPEAGLIADVAGNLYGTTYAGGAAGDGIIFQLPAGSNIIKVLASFDGLHGANPTAALLRDSTGNLFGTTSAGGTAGLGTVFELPGGSSTITTLVSFNDSNGATPLGSLIADTSGNLYGTTSQGGTNENGTVFEIPAGTSNLTTLASFSGANGANPEAGLLVDASGDLFGTTSAGGTAGLGTVFELPFGSPLLSSLASFDGSNGATPQGNLVADSSGNLIGTTLYGGSGFTGPSTGYGTLFELPLSIGSIIPLALLSGGSDGANPVAGLTHDALGNLYGAATAGGTANYGNVFALPVGSTSILPIASFPGTVGANPYSGLVKDANGNLYGTSLDGGPHGDGTVFVLPPGGSTVTTLATFNYTNGAYPRGTLVLDKGYLIGTTYYGGSSGNGTVFKVPTSGGALTTIASFNGLNGANPASGVIVDAAGNLFGTTYQGGTFSDGAVFEIASGSSTITDLAMFSGSNGMNPLGGLIEDKSGILYGTTVQGGSAGDGTVFKISSVGGPLSTLVSFNSTAGINPVGTLVEDASGNLYGTTFNGGTAGDGTVFAVATSNGALTTLASLSGSNGANPYAGLVVTSASSLLGAAAYGGPASDGTVFVLPINGGNITPLATFNLANGAQPIGGLLLDASGDLFGTTVNGGPPGSGTIFELTSVIPVISTTSLASWTVNQPGYSQTILAGGGFGSLTFSAGGNLPVGLTLSSSGVLSGTPTVAGSYTFTVAATDGAGQVATQSFTLFIYPQATTLAVSSPPSAVAGTPFNLTVQAQDGAGNLAGGYNGAVTLASSLGADIIPTTITLHNGAATVPVTLTAAGSQTLTASTPGLTSGSAVVTVSPGAYSQYLVSITGPGTVQAGTNFLVTVQAADTYGNPVSSYSGPGVMPSISPASPGASYPSTVSLNSQGLGLFLASLQQVGSYTVAVAAGSITSNRPAITVTPGSAVKLNFGSQPVTTPTGLTLPPVTVQVQDAFGNLITSDNSDQVTLGIAAGPGPGAPGFLPASTLTATVQGGVATFSNLMLATPGTYQLGAIVAGLYTGPSSSTFNVLPLQVLAGSFAGSPGGFSLAFNAPLLINSVTPVLFGRGFGAAAPAPSATLTQIQDASGNPVDNPVEDSLILNAATNTITFLATNTAYEVNNGSPVLPDGTYRVDLTSSAATNGFQALNSGGGFLDGLGSGVPGSGDFTTTFTVNAAASNDDVLWVPATADGPGQPLSAPGMNQAGGGYPLYLNDTTGAVTSVLLTLNYDPTLLNVSGVSGAGFTLLDTSTPGHALLQYSGPPLPKGAQIPIGYLSATVPAGSSAIPTPYKAKDLLHLSGGSLNGGTIPVVTSDGLHLVAYVGDADGNGNYSSSDAVLLTRVGLQTDSGFTAYPLVDPVIVGDTDGSGFIPADAALQINEAGVGFATANLPNPPTPANVVFQAIPNNVDPTLSLGIRSQGPGGSNDILTVAVNIDDAHPEGSTGLIEAHLALTFDPSLYTVSAADIRLGNVLAAGVDWRMIPTINPVTGEIAISLSSNTPISSAAGGSLVTIDFRLVGSSPAPSYIALAPSVDPTGTQIVRTDLEDTQGTFTLSFAPGNLL